ncbi:hypothetical protein GCM10023196_023260 [Actinoallomurus vinaceus]|uniref:Uncharacterized protein n=1 Tax=Actinoallomurus vinaceus TaxID=1080074 RepID=A0ABP8U5L5_9ACTN
MGKVLVANAGPDVPPGPVPASWRRVSARIRGEGIAIRAGKRRAVGAGSAVDPARDPAVWPDSAVPRRSIVNDPSALEYNGQYRQTI